MVMRKQRINASCPRCTFSEEKTTHVLLCQGEGICELRKATILELRVWMKSVHTQPDIEHIVIHCLTRSLSSGELQFELDDNIDPVILNACKYQFLLGEETLLHGLYQND